MYIHRTVFALTVLLSLSKLGCTLRCFTCEDCTDGERGETNCIEGESCMKLDLEVAGFRDLRFRFERRLCGRDGDDQHCLTEGKALKKNVMMNRLNEETTEITSNVCTYCNDKDFCNNSVMLYSSSVLFVALYFLLRLI